MSYTLPHAVYTAFDETTKLYTAYQMQAAYQAGRASRDSEVEALRAKVVELDNDTADLAMLADQYKAERDTLAAKLAALEGQPDTTALEYMRGYSDGKAWAEGQATVGYVDGDDISRRILWDKDFDAFSLEVGTKVYTSAGAQAQPLTNDQIYELYSEPRSDAEMVEFARAVEKAHGIGGSV